MGRSRRKVGEGTRNGEGGKEKMKERGKGKEEREMKRNEGEEKREWRKEGMEERGGDGERRGWLN